MAETCELCESIKDSGTDNQKKYQITKTGKWLLGLTGLSFAGVMAVTSAFVSPALRKICLPYVPATSRQVANVMHMLEGKTGRLVDLGSGDGRLVIEAAKRGFYAEGVELNRWLVWYSRIKAWREGVSNSAKFHRRDIFKTDFSKFDQIIVFGVDSMMEPLARSLKTSATSHCEVIACRFPFQEWTALKCVDEGIDTVWLYKPFRKSDRFSDT